MNSTLANSRHIPTRRIPAEWEPQQALLLIWPHEGGSWGEDLAAVTQTFTTIVEYVHRHQQVIIVCSDEGHCRQLQSVFSRRGFALEMIHCCPCPSDDSWARDCMPLSVVVSGESNIHLSDFTFTGWGGRYPAAKDQKITTCLEQQGTFSAYTLDYIDWEFEGGAIESDGCGLLLSTSTFIQARHPQLSTLQIKEKLSGYLGCERLYLLENGWLPGDHTDSHIDMLVRFVAADTIVYTACTDAQYPGHESLQAMAVELTQLKKSDGGEYHCIPLFRPTTAALGKNIHYPYNYVNFTICNGCVLLPQYGCSDADTAAMQVLQQCFPEHRVVGIDCSALIRHGGALHCVTMPLF